MLHNNHMIFDLEKALTFKTQIENRNVAEANRCRVSILEEGLYDGIQPVILLAKITGENVYYQYCYPLTAEQLDLLTQSESAATMRSGKHLKAGHDTFMGNHFAYASISFPLEGGAIDFEMAAEYLRELLEGVLACCV